MTGLYVHVPFCTRACPYCDFDFEVSRSPDVDAYLDGLTREVGGREVPAAPRTIYLGGGTPSALGPMGLGRVLEWLARTVDTTHCREWTVELNPEHVTGELARRLVDGGVTRASLGVQTFDEHGLSQLGRVHDPDSARASIEVVLAAGLRTSIDLIVGWPGQGPDAIATDIAELAGLGVTHVSVYALTVEAGTPWEALVRRGKRRLPLLDEQADRLEQVERGLVDLGFEHYEVASYGRGEDRSLHNESYWRWTDYVGLGPSAHSAAYAADGSVERRGNRRGIGRWREQPADPEEHEVLGPAVAAAEGAWLGLRRLEGFSIVEYLRRFPGVDEAWLDARLRPPLRRGDLLREGDRVRVAEGRWLVLDRIGRDVLVGD